MINIVIVEDQEEVQNLLIEILQLSTNITLTGAFFDGRSAIRNIPLLRPDIVFMDIGLPDISGVECIKVLKPRCPDTEFMVFSVFGDEGHVFEALQAGASAYLLKTAKPEFMLNSIEELFNGGSPMSPEIARVLISGIFSKPVDHTEGCPNNAGLTTREFEILELLAKGYLYKEVSSMLNISLNTVKVHCYKIYQKLHVTNKIEAISKVFGKRL